MIPHIATRYLVGQYQFIVDLLLPHQYAHPFWILHALHELELELDPCPSMLSMAGLQLPSIRTLWLDIDLCHQADKVWRRFLASAQVVSHSITLCTECDRVWQSVTMHCVKLCDNVWHCVQCSVSISSLITTWVSTLSGKSISSSLTFTVEAAYLASARVSCRRSS